MTLTNMSELLVVDTALPADLRQAIEDGRTDEAGRLLMEQFGLSCEEAAALVDRSLCH